jgi:hypothetical protein
MIELTKSDCLGFCVATTTVSERVKRRRKKKKRLGETKNDGCDESGHSSSTNRIIRVKQNSIG